MNMETRHLANYPTIYIEIMTKIMTDRFELTN